MNHRTHLHYFLHDVLVILLPIPQLSSRRHQEKLHGLPKVEMKILVATGHETCDLISIDKECDKFTILYTTIDNYFMKRSCPLSHKVYWLITDLKGCHGEVAEFYSLI